MMPPVLLLTDRSQLPLGRSLRATVSAAVAAGVDHVVLRELDLPWEQRAGLAEEFVDVGATVIAAHRPLPGCVGVHLPAESAPTRPTNPPSRRQLGRVHADSAPHGRSCHSAAEVRRAAAAGASYATLGPFAATASKPGHGPPLPREEYADLPVPVYALGGVDADNAAAAVGAGAHGVAVMGAWMRASDPAALVARLREVVA
ncbi:thiamine phosphate synthase [Nocardioides panacisoli]|uniref:thiamine phosphate synthase n=1 Tax=Nocardioides panacisoli TaxID=627624 RepID=UPI001C62F307|nr:thiamine phosphate synthase [Nocardioides panacisoli]QYJ02639.1 thiamine phosphate synthase [Nocardioides panacisoli]